MLAIPAFGRWEQEDQQGQHELREILLSLKKKKKRGGGGGRGGRNNFPGTRKWQVLVTELREGGGTTAQATRTQLSRMGSDTIESLRQLSCPSVEQRGARTTVFPGHPFAKRLCPA